MQPPPSAADLLATVAGVLADDVVPALSGPVQHHARVAASLVAIVERELRLGPDVDAHERAALGELLATLGADPADGAPDDLAARRARLADVLRAGAADHPDDAGRTWDVLMQVVRNDLRIARPGHDDWDGD